jgi:hypothetical protein
LESGGSTAPDLLEPCLVLNRQAFGAVLHDVSAASAEMPKFDDLDDYDISVHYVYIRQSASESAVHWFAQAFHYPP